jgi:alkaline phosphatase D
MHGPRRLFLLEAARLAAATAGAGYVGAAPAAARDPYPFSLGVASGSPLPDSVILWTRILPDPLNAASTPAVALSVRWEVAEDEGFRRTVARGTATAVPALAHSVHVEAKGLQPGRWYWYRFMFGDAVSPVGRTRTAPAPGSMPSVLKLAVASCQHWEFGSYAAHRHIAAGAPDLVAFLGDYIYEWGPFRLTHPDKGELPGALCAVQERSRLAGRAPGGALDRHVGRPRSRQRLCRGARRAPGGGFCAAARGRVPGLLRAHAAAPARPQGL